MYNDAIDVQQMAENIVGRTTFDGYKLTILEISDNVAMGQLFVEKSEPNTSNHSTIGYQSSYGRSQVVFIVSQFFVVLSTTV
jgi:hypothetical protein